MDSGQGGTLFRHLSRRHQYRKRQNRYGVGPRFIPGRVGIEELTYEVGQRSRFCGWEDDLVLGRRGVGAIATHVGHKSQYLMATLLSNRKAGTFKNAGIPIYQLLPKHLRQTLTLGNGKEFSRFKELKTKTKLAMYFADPYSA